MHDWSIGSWWLVNGLYNSSFRWHTDPAGRSALSHYIGLSDFIDCINTTNSFVLCLLDCINRCAAGSHSCSIKQLTENRCQCSAVSNIDLSIIAAVTLNSLSLCYICSKSGHHDGPSSCKITKSATCKLLNIKYKSNTPPFPSLLLPVNVIPILRKFLTGMPQSSVRCH